MSLLEKSFPGRVLNARRITWSWVVVFPDQVTLFQVALSPSVIRISKLIESPSTDFSIGVMLEKR